MAETRQKPVSCITLSLHSVQSFGKWSETWVPVVPGTAFIFKLIHDLNQLFASQQVSTLHRKNKER